MENKNDINPPIEKRKCKKCGRLLPISYFERFGKRGYHVNCKACEGKEYSKDERFKDVQSRDLILELRARGYKGKLQKVIVEDVVI